MHFTRIILPIVFVLSASTALAAKPGKTLVCHVGNEVGPEGQVYNPDCVPDEFYDCSADAGKVDLILVSRKAAAKHIAEEGEDPIHYFEDDAEFLWKDYAPEEGVGDDPADFEEGDVVGIDKGCELEDVASLECPCWSDYTQQGLVDAFNTAYAGTTHSCYFSDNNVSAGSLDSSKPQMAGINNRCTLEMNREVTSYFYDSQSSEAEICVREAWAVVSQLDGCPES